MHTNDVGFNYKHGMSFTPEYRAWRSMKERCLNTRHKAYSRYGGRGIAVCDRWLEFEHFYTDMGDRTSPEHSLDRIDNDGGYEPGNCKWSTRIEQQFNRRSTKPITFMGETKVAREWGEAIGLHEDTIHQRIRHGWPLERALTEPGDYTSVNRPRNSKGQYAPVT